MAIGIIRALRSLHSHQWEMTRWTSRHVELDRSSRGVKTVIQYTVEEYCLVCGRERTRTFDHHMSHWYDARIGQSYLDDGVTVYMDKATGYFSPALGSE